MSNETTKLTLQEKGAETASANNAFARERFIMKVDTTVPDFHGDTYPHPKQQGGDREKPEGVEAGKSDISGGVTDPTAGVVSRHSPR